MNKLVHTLQEIKNRRRIGIMSHVVLGYPSLEQTITIVKTMAKQGVDMVEIQIPFSDPIADGTTIMNACENALKNGTKVKDAFTIMNQLTHMVSIPLLFMGYYNTVFHYGVEKFCHDAALAGATGLIIPDMAIDEEHEEHLLSNCKKYQLHNIQVISPISTKSRLKKNAQVANGFIYCTSRVGTTGVQRNIDINQATYLHKVRQYTDLPLAIGFGISKKEQIMALLNHADIAVIGSAIIEIINESEKNEIEENIKNFLNDILP